MYTQPGVNGGLPVHIKLPRVPKTFEPNATAALAAFQVISEDTSLSDRYINVTAQGGTVVVSGSVQTADEKKLALADAKSAKGVTSVIDQLTVKP